MSKYLSLASHAFKTFAPPPKLTLSQWADQYAYLSAESSADPGKWKSLPYQVGIMDTISDPRVERVSVMKSARVGFSKLLGHIVGFHIHYDPCSIMIVQPTEADAEGYSKEEIAPMLRDTPCLRKLVYEAKSKDSNTTILSKNFVGGVLSLVGANSPRGFRRVSRRIVIFDEVDGYPPSAGAEGDQIKLGIKRTEYYWNRKIIAGSTPTVTGLSRIEGMFLDGDQRYFEVPCPHCNHFQVLKFQNLKWPEGSPELAHFICTNCAKEISHDHKRDMVTKGKWVAIRPFTGHASFHIWAAYSFSPNATWEHIAKEFLDAKHAGREELKTFINTTLGEVWREKEGDAPDWAAIYNRREKYKIGEIHDRVVFVTAGADVQKDRIEIEFKGWAPNKENWSLDYVVIPGDTADEKTWEALDREIARVWIRPNGIEVPVKAVGIDSGFNTQHVYNWVRRYPSNRVFALKGQANAATLIGSPSAVDVTVKGKRISRGLKVWPVGVSIAKGELYSWLKNEKLTDEQIARGEQFAPGYCHYPEYGEEFFKQLTSEQMVSRVSKGRRVYEWQKTRERNEAIDTSIYNRAVASIMGLDRFSENQWLDMAGAQGIAIAPKTVQTEKKAPSAPKPAQKTKRYGSFL